MQKFLGNESGTTAILFAVGGVAVFGAVGLGISMAQHNDYKASLQASLDAAVLAGESASFKSRDVAFDVAQRVFVANWQANKPGGPKIVPEFIFRQSNLVGSVSTTFHGTFSGLFGASEIPVAAVSEASRAAGSPVCVLAMADVEKESVYVYGSASFEAKACAVHSNSASGDSLSLDGSRSSAKAEAFSTRGNASGDSWSPAPITGTSVLKDPFANIPVPKAGPCDYTNLVVKNDTTLSPGTYCGGLSMTTGAVVVMNPGQYVVKDGALNVSSHATLSGDRVILALVGANAILNIQSGGNVSLTSPTEGIYKNMQIMSDRDLTQSKFQQEWSTILGGGKLEFDGVMYLPEQNFWISGTDHTTTVKSYSPSLTMVADTYWFQGNAVVETEYVNKRGIDTTGLAGARTQNSVVLVR